MASFYSKPNPPHSLYAHVKKEKEKASFVLLTLEILKKKNSKKKIYKDPENSSFFHYVFTFNQAYHLPPHIEVHRMYLLSISQYCSVLA